MNDAMPPRGSLVFLWLSGLIVAFDQLSKFVIERELALLQSITVLPVLEITRRNVELEARLATRIEADCCCRV